MPETKADAQTELCADCGEPLDSWRRKTVYRDHKPVHIHTECRAKLVAPKGPSWCFHLDWYGPFR